MRFTWCLFFLVALTISCTPFNYSSSTGAVARSVAQEPEHITQSLFFSKDQTISEENIQRLLTGQIKLPDSVRVAVFKHKSQTTNRYYESWWNDEEYLKTEQRFIDTLFYAIKQSRSVTKVTAIPSLMIGNNPNITQLRETAVRLQVDLLVVFALNSDVYYKYKAFQKNESKAYATCEMIIMDLRTGVVPFSSIVTREFTVVKQTEDSDNNETRKRAQNGAVLLSLIESGKRISGFLTKK